jgi:hypothetical protein
LPHHGEWTIGIFFSAPKNNNTNIGNAMPVKRRTVKSGARKPRKWSARVTQTSDAMDLRQNVFRLSDPKKIALSVKRSAQQSKRRKGTPYQSAMSMLNFYINRAGKNLSATRKAKIEKAKDELRALFHRTEV